MRPGRKGSQLAQADALIEAIDAEARSGRAGAGEQQREKVEALIRRYNAGKPSWSVAEFADELLALLGGPQPDGDDRQHRMDADCWCQPVQAANGAWDHQ